MPSQTRIDELNRLSGEEAFGRTDSLLRPYLRRVVRGFSRLRSGCSREDDEAALMVLVYACYSRMWEDYQNALLRAFIRSYAGVLGKCDQDTAEAAIDRYTTSYALPEGFVPRAEWERKRARAYESVVARRWAGLAPTAEVTRARNLWAGQLRQGADDATVLGRSDAMSAAGVTRVRFHTQRDGRVCGECRGLDGRVYRLGSEPRIPLHHNCRCWYSAEG